MSWRDYDEDGVPLWNEAHSPKVQEKIEREWRFRMEMLKHEMPAREFKSQDSEVKSNNSMFAKATNYLKSFIGNGNK